MSTLIVSECDPSVYQQITADENMFVVAIRPHLYIHGSPSGTVKVQVQDENGYVITESSAQTITDLKTATYAHKYIEFELNTNFVEGSVYRLAVVCEGGYSFSESAYVGVCLDWDNPKINASYNPNVGASAALDFEIWVRKAS